MNQPVIQGLTAALLLFLCTALIGCATSSFPSAETPQEPAPSRPAAGAQAGPLRQILDPDAEFAPQTPEGLRTLSVPAIVSEGEIRLVSPRHVRDDLILTEVPTPARSGPRPLAMRWDGEPGAAVPFKTLDASFDSSDFDTNWINTGGSIFIPPDPSAAAGQNHVVNVVNVTVRFHQKDGTLDFDTSLANFFAAEAPLNFTYDPKVIYDQFEDRFVIVTLQVTDVVNGDPADTSRIMVAVSDDGDPNGTWYTTSWNSSVVISVATWADYPCFAVDQAAVYISTNMFGFQTTGGNFRGSRQWVIDKGVAGGFYANGPASIIVYDLFTALGIPFNQHTTTQPAHMFGTSPFAAGSGTFFTSFSGLNDGVNEWVLVMTLEDPLGAPSAGSFYVNLGVNMDDVAANVPDAPQLGTATLIETNDRRTLHSVYRDDDSLWVTTTIDPEAGDPEAGQATAYWIELDTSLMGVGVISVADQGQIGGEDIAPNTHTFFPSIGVNSDGDVGIGFSASASTIYAGAYYTTRQPGDPAGTTRPTELLRAGTDYYQRTFGGPQNRWGDYSGLAVDPITECFWAYNEYAMARGTGIPPEDGRWATAYGLYCPCSVSYGLTANLWKMISLACNVGTLNTVADVFGNDDLAPGDFGTTWTVYKRDEAAQVYVELTLSDPLEEGEGYWIKTLDAGQTVKVEGRRNAVIDVPLVSAATGRQNLAGHPFAFDVCWADVRVMDGAAELTLAQADPVVGIERACESADPLGNGCVMSRVGNIWSGAAYQPFDGETPGMKGTLTPMDGVWVKAFKSGISLRIPALAGSSCESKAQAEGATVRLIAESGDLRDAGNVLGWFRESVDGYDRHDLREMPPLDDRYLTLVFPHDDWGKHAGDYASDLRAWQGSGQTEWRFDILASELGGEVTLRWEGSPRILQYAQLVDEATGELIRVDPNGSYAFRMNTTRRAFRWRLGIPQK